MRVRLAWASAVAAVGLVTACATGLLQPEPDGGSDASCSTCNDGGPTSDAHPPSPDGGCNTGETKCLLDGGALCANVQTDPNHCGTCNTACLPNVETCTAGKCVNACGTKTLCEFDAGADAGDASVPPPYCADLQNDSNNCGTCGHSCGTQACTAGKCPCTGGTQTFNYTGSQQTFVVPCGTTVTITAYGAQGANANDVLSSKHAGGLGGSATGTLAVKPGDTLYINVGGQGDNTTGAGGWNGGGAGGTSSAGSGCNGGPAGGGGGMSDVRVGGTALANIVIAAAGGGGSGRDYCNGSCVPCGCGGGNGGGGGSTGTAGGAAYNCGFNYPGSGVNGGQGGTQSAGGAGGTNDGTTGSGTPGSQGGGGAGVAGQYDVAGGGGGGGYYGGGGGGGASAGSGVGGGGGGGGSSYVGGVTNGSTSAGVQNGDGKITITWQ